MKFGIAVIGKGDILNLPATEWLPSKAIISKKHMIIVILGLPGAGKSYLAEKVADRFKALYLSSDQIRQRGNRNISYNDSSKDKIYKEMFSEMESAVATGKNVVLDATFYRKSLRKRLLAQRAVAPLYFVEVVASEETIKERLKKQRKYSDADFKVYQKVREQFESLEADHLTLRSDQLSISEMLRQVGEYIAINDQGNETRGG